AAAVGKLTRAEGVSPVAANCGVMRPRTSSKPFARPSASGDEARCCSRERMARASGDVPRDEARGSVEVPSPVRSGPLHEPAATATTNAVRNPNLPALLPAFDLDDHMNRLQ